MIVIHPPTSPPERRMFKGTLAWASNFAPVQVTLDGLVFPSVEHGYQASKTDNQRLRLVIANAGLAADARRLGKRLTLSLDWEQQRDVIMFDLLKQKFSTPKYTQLLLLTGDEYICEWNNWGDRYWGRDIVTGQGENHLGRMLMSLRRLIQRGEL